jgi:hypothetical protein
MVIFHSSNLPDRLSVPNNLDIEIVIESNPDSETIGRILLMIKHGNRINIVCEDDNIRTNLEALQLHLIRDLTITGD